MPNGPVTPGNTGLGDGANLLYSDGMRLTSRDASILQALDRFGQLDSGHIWDLHFSECKSTNSWYQVAERLVRDKFIVQMGQRAKSGNGRGSGKYVYQLGATGWQYLGKRGAFRARFSSVDEHRLKVADVFAQFCEQEDAGALKICGYYTEPDSHMKVAGVTVRPDLFLDVLLTASDERLHIMVEVDRNTENKTEIQRKVADYITMFDWASKDELEEWPHVVFLAESDIGIVNLNRYMYGKLRGKRLDSGKDEPKDYSDWITVGHFQGFAGRLSATA